MKYVFLGRYLLRELDTTSRLVGTDISSLCSTLMHSVNVEHILTTYYDELNNFTMADLEIVEEKMEELLETPPFNLTIPSTTKVVGAINFYPCRVEITLKGLKKCELLTLK